MKVVFGGAHSRIRADPMSKISNVEARMFEARGASAGPGCSLVCRESRIPRDREHGSTDNPNRAGPWGWLFGRRAPS